MCVVGVAVDSRHADGTPRSEMPSQLAWSVHYVTTMRTPGGCDAAERRLSCNASVHDLLSLLDTLYARFGRHRCRVVLYDAAVATGWLDQRVRECTRRTCLSERHAPSPRRPRDDDEPETEVVAITSFESYVGGAMLSRRQSIYDGRPSDLDLLRTHLSTWGVDREVDFAPGGPGQCTPAQAAAMCGGLVAVAHAASGGNYTTIAP
jgi:hypothetical protein